MAVIELKTTMEDASNRVRGIKTYDIRPKHMGIKVGDTIKYVAYFNGKPIAHDITGKRYRVVYVDRKDPRVLSDHIVFALQDIQTGWI